MKTEKTEIIQMYDGEWYPIRKRKWSHGCCDCLLMHFADFKVVKGRLYTRWTKDVSGTRYWRRKEQKKKP